MVTLKLCVLLPLFLLTACSSSLGPVEPLDDAQDAPPDVPVPCVPIPDPALCAAPSFVVDGVIYDRAYTCDATERPAILCELNKRTNTYCCRYGNA